ncbi:MAG: hypothetical protein ACLR0B_00930 [Anaerobutyricum soehngenii]
MKLGANKAKLAESNIGAKAGTLMKFCVRKWIMYEKIDRWLALCELQATAFEKFIDKMDSSSEIFIRRFMKSNIAKRMDDESILESNLQANDIYS